MALGLLRASQNRDRLCTAATCAGIRNPHTRSGQLVPRVSANRTSPVSSPSGRPRQLLYGFQSSLRRRGAEVAGALLQHTPRRPVAAH
ncbi:hypothetical protein L226DRAFT_255737 [Lentinus tigrinus ALCF2SS1-7]|uniref:uncharacterized protein n=1 Tax=Lentinus tigrinus ALCF2SS1-7 TaxID=1328758 RepID=UPI001166055A|nr:hypothetical protein L226DRAFT_255737 [Lentinus tigrinus ALCF2SS1-7]